MQELEFKWLMNDKLFERTQIRNLVKTIGQIKLRILRAGLGKKEAIMHSKCLLSNIVSKIDKVSF
jgi:hypothetical protein